MKISHRHRCSAWLALLAMLLISLAPVVSQALAMAHVPAGQEAAMSGHARGDAGPVALDLSDHPDHSDHSDHDLSKCGYCTLLTQLPVLGHCGGVVLNVPQLGGEPVQHGSRHHHAIKLNFPAALARAPPPQTGNDTSLPGA